MYFFKLLTKYLFAMKKITLFLAALLISMTAFAVNITGGTKLYLKPNSNWVKDGAWFAAYFCNGSSTATWVEMNLVENGIYEVTVPSGHSHKNVIFCRMNPAKTTLSWDAKWNQSGDLTWDGSKNLCTIKDGQWDCGSNVTWSTYTPPTEPVVHTYTLAGDNATLFGNTWTPSDANNDLVDNGDGTWSKTYNNVVFAASTTIEFKVCEDYDWTNSWGENGEGANALYTISEAGTYDVTFTFTLSTKKTVVTATKQQTIDPGEDPEPDPEPVVHTYTLAGDNISLFGTAWDTKNTNNDLVDNGDGTWSKTYNDVVFDASTTIKFKVCLDYTWDTSWGENGGDADASYIISEAGTYDITFTFTLSTKITIVTAIKQQTTDPGEDPTPDPDPEPTTYTIYFDNNGTNWENVNAYYWTVDPIVAWPGVAMTKVEGHDDFYSYTTTQSYVNIIFNNGLGTQTADLEVPTDGKNCYSYATKTWSVYKAPVVPDPEPTTYTVYYDNTNTKWETVNAYCWNSAGNNSWPGEAMTPIVGHEGFFSYTTTTAYDNIIFNNGNGVQTIDLVFPKDNNNTFTIIGEEDGKKTGTWSAYVAPDPNKLVVRFTNLGATAPIYATIKPEAAVENIENPTFAYTVSYAGGEAVALDENGYSLNDYGVYEFTVVATGDNGKTAKATAIVEVELVAVMGSSELCHGYYWEKAKENAMYPVDGVYTITYKDVPAGTYEFKVGFGKQAMLGIESIDSENSTPGFTGENNISFTLSETTDIVISYSTLTGKVILKGVGLEKFGEFVATSYTLCGSEAIFGENFNTTLTANDMVETSTGVWTKTYSNVALQAEVVYYYKVAANYGWNVGQYPTAGDLSLKVEEAGNYNLTFTYEPNKAEGEKLVCDVEKIVEVEPITYTVSFDNTVSSWEKVYAYCWNGEGDAAVANAAWPGVELTNPENNVYTYTTTTTYEKVIFNAGEGKPQTMDLVFENGKTYFIDIAYVLGTVNYEKIENDECWTPGVAEYKMTYDATTGIWAKTYTNLPAGDYQFKLYCGDWLNKVEVDSVSSTLGFKYDNLGDNISFTLSDITTVTITYNPMLNTFTIVGQGIDKFGELVVTSYTLCGSKEIFGGEKDFDETLTANDMTEKDGVWSKTYEGVQLAAYNEETEEGVQYMYKVAANHAWNGAAYPSADLRVVFWVAEAGKYNITFTFTPDSEEFKLNHIIEKVNEGPVTEVENAVIANIYTQSGMVVAEGEFQIFTITGQNVTDMNGNLANGVYVVRTANATAKVVVK